MLLFIIIIIIETNCEIYPIIHAPENEWIIFLVYINVVVQHYFHVLLPCIDVYSVCSPSHEARGYIDA